MKCPCKKCKPPDRNETCHGTCARYIEWKEEYDKEAERVRFTIFSDHIARPDKPVRIHKKK